MPWDELPPLPHPQAAGLAVSVYTPAECEARRQRNLERGKLMPQAYVDATAEELAEICNGIGTDKFGPVVLGVSSGLFRIFTDDADIHDYWWTKLNDGSREAWHKSNSDFRHNTGVTASFCDGPFELIRDGERDLLQELGEALAWVVSTEEIGWPIWRDAEHCEPGPEVIA